VMKKTVDSVLGRTEVRIGPEPAAMLRVGGCATAGRAAQQERRHDDAWNQDVIKTKTADTRATRYSLYVLHSTPPRATSQGAKKHKSEDVKRSLWNLFGLSQPCTAQKLRSWTRLHRGLLASRLRRAGQAS
jgi:hypothetical protein